MIVAQQRRCEKPCEPTNVGCPRSRANGSEVGNYIMSKEAYVLNG